MTGTESTKPPEAGPVSAQPASRLRDASKAREMLSHASRRNQERIALFSEIADSYERVPPESANDLYDDGLGWSCNVSWGGMEQAIDSAVEPLFNLATSAETYVKLASRHETRTLGTQLRTIAEEDKTMVEAWDDSDAEWELMLHFRKAFGLGIFYFRQPRGWHYSALNPANAVFPAAAPLNPNKWPWFGVRTTFDIIDLVAKLSDPETSKLQGWDLAEIRKLIESFRQNAASSHPSASDPDAFIRDLADHGTAYSQTGNTTVPGWVLYIREWDGRVSEHLVPDKDGSGYLFSAVGRYPDLTSVVSLFPDSLGQGLVERVRGLGVKMLPYFDAEDRLLNQGFDATFISSSLILQGGNPGDLMRAQEISLGPFTYLPDNVNVVQQRFANPIEGLLALQGEIERRGASRSSAFGGKQSVGREVEKTLGEARLAFQEGKSLEGYAIQRFYRQLSVFHRNRFNRAFLDPTVAESDPGATAAAGAVVAMLGRGVEPDTLLGIHKVTAAKAFGDGNPGNQWLAMMDMTQFIGMMSEEGKRKFAKTAMTARLQSPEMAEEFLGAPGEDDLDRDQRNEAQTESGVLLVSDARIDVAGSDNHIIHCGVHTVVAEDIVRAWEQGSVPLETALQVITRHREHMESGHMAGLASDQLAQDVWDDVRQRWASLINSERQMTQQLEAQREEQQQQQLEELKNPQPSVKEREAAMTEELKRTVMANKAQTELDMLKQKTQAEILVMKAQASAALENRRQDTTNNTP